MQGFRFHEEIERKMETTTLSRVRWSPAKLFGTPDGFFLPSCPELPCQDSDGTRYGTLLARRAQDDNMTVGPSSRSIAQDPE